MYKIPKTKYRILKEVADSFREDVQELGSVYLDFPNGMMVEFKMQSPNTIMKKFSDYLEEYLIDNPEAFPTGTEVVFNSEACVKMLDDLAEKIEETERIIEEAERIIAKNFNRISELEKLTK